MSGSGRETRREEVLRYIAEGRALICGPCFGKPIPENSVIDEEMVDEILKEWRGRRNLDPGVITDDRGAA